MQSELSTGVVQPGAGAGEGEEEGGQVKSQLSSSLSLYGSQGSQNIDTGSVKYMPFAAVSTLTSS
tara:strand:+ start:400 stop:594 length:195 start_codon:yes stop_codon:yes gene_type:complete